MVDAENKYGHDDIWPLLIVKIMQICNKDMLQYIFAERTSKIFSVKLQCVAMENWKTSDNEL